MEEIGLNELLLVLQKHKKIIFGAVGLFLVLGIIVSSLILQPHYQTFSTFIVGVGKPLAGDEEVIYSNVLLNNNLVTTYAQIAKSSEVLNQTIKNLKLDLSPEIFKKKIRVVRVEGTEIIKIEVSDRDPEFAVRIANEVSNVFISRIREIMKIDNVHLLDKPELPRKPVKPKLLLNLLISAVLGAIIGIVTAFLFSSREQKLKVRGDAVNSFCGIKGKTSSALNLAISLSREGEKVLLVDGNQNKSEIQALLGLAEMPGLADLLSKNTDHQEAIQFSGFANLDVLTAGNLTEIHNLDGLKELFNLIPQKYTVLLFNLPSLESPLAPALSSISGGVVLFFTV